MKKRNYWPLFFIAIFTFTFSMVIWTVMSAIKTPVHEDKSFLSSYHIMDVEFNDIVDYNKKFTKKYNLKMKINDKEFDGLIINDVFLSQRVIDHESMHKDIFKKGINNISFDLTTKDGVEVPNFKISFKVTRTTNSYSDIDMNNDKNKNKKFTFNLDKAGNWNITGILDTNDGEKGFFYIKSNATDK